MKKLALFLPSRCTDVVEELNTTGTGAREQIADVLARHLAIDHEVHIFTNVKKPHHNRNLHWVEQEIAATMLTTYEWDALISFDFPSVATLPDIRDTVKKVIVSQNYFEIPPEGFTPDVFDLIDTWVYPSEFAKVHCSAVNGTDPKRGVVIPYMVDDTLYNRPWEKHDSLRFIYANQAESGLAQTLRMWPEIISEFPDATLTVATPVDEFVEQIQWSHSVQSELALDIRDLITQPGLSYIGRQGKESLAAAFYASDFLLYPAEPLSPSEIGSLPILQAASAGCHPIFAPVDALPELYHGMGTPCPANKFLTKIESSMRNLSVEREIAYNTAHGTDGYSLRKWDDLLANK